MRRKTRPVMFVCSGIVDNKLVSKIVEGSTIEASTIIFEEEFKTRPESVLGPFFKKRLGTLNKNFDLKFKFGENKQGIYEGWEVTAMPLASPENSYYILFNKKIDGKKATKPQSIVVRKEEIKDLK